nr:hypothetical protein CFP56_75403 [Quercus suber]
MNFSPMLVQENGAKRPAPERDMRLLLLPRSWNLDLKTIAEYMRFAEIHENLNWVISSIFWIIPKKKLLELCFLDGSSMKGVT